MNHLLSNRTWRERTAWQLFRAVLFTLPWIGLGLVKATTGRELGTGVQASWLLLALVCLLLAPELARFLGRTRREWLPVAGPVLLAMLISVAGLWLAPGAEVISLALLRFGKQVVQVVIMLAFVLVPAYYLASGRSLATVGRPVVWGAIFQAGYGLAQGVHFYHPLRWMATLEHVFTSNPAILAGSEQLYLANVLQHVPRLRGTACEPLYLGSFLLLALPLVPVTGWSRRRQVLVAVILGLLLGATWSRGAWLAAVAGMGLGLVAAARTGLLGRHSWSRRWWWGVGAAVLVGLIWGGPGPVSPWQRLVQTFSTQDWSNLTRLYSMQAAWRAFLLSPVVGIGWGQFAFHFAALVDPMGLQSMFTWPVVNNFPLEILCETGLLGGLGLLWLAYRLIWLIRRRLVRAPVPVRTAVLLLSVGVGAVWLQLLTFSQYNLPHIWVALGLLVGALLAPERGSA